MDWQNIAGFGIAGNMTGHLEQAGEAGDFTQVQVLEATAPKGIFPFYIPKSPATRQLHVMPLSSTLIELNPDGERYQIEPEMSLLCDLHYKDGAVSAIVPLSAMAHNDCSIRKKGAKKISSKKNWGPHTKGVSTNPIAIDQFSAGGILDHIQLTSYLLRDEHLHLYGVSSPVISYSYFYEQLLDWMIEKFAHQKDEGPLENLKAALAEAQYPAQALISIGATRYTRFGETNFLKPNDIAIVALYDTRTYTEQDIREIIRQGDASRPHLSLLRQTVRLRQPG